MMKTLKRLGAYMGGRKYLLPCSDVYKRQVDEFIAGYPVKEMGRYIVKGNTVSYVKFKDIIVNITPFLAKQYGKYYNMNICVQNFSKKSILFNPSNIKVEGYNFKVDKSNNTYIPQQVDLQLLSYTDYDKIVKRKQNWNNFWVALGEGMAAYSAGQSLSLIHIYLLFRGSSNQRLINVPLSLQQGKVVLWEQEDDMLCP